jgi:hypothetical protein
VDVRDVEAAGAERLLSSAVEPRGAGPIAATEEVCTTRSTPGAQRLLHDDPRALDVDAEELLAAGAQRGVPGDVEDAVDAAQGAADAAAVEDVAVTCSTSSPGRLSRRERWRTAART